MTKPLPLLQLPAFMAGKAVLGTAHDWTWHEVHAAAAELAGRLEPGSPVCNLCATRVGFLVAWLAALRRGCLQLLPPSGGRADLAALLDAVPGTTVVVDDETLLQPVAGARIRGLVFLPQVPRPLPDATQLAWEPDWKRVAFCLYTSGTTGQPQPQYKTLGQLTRGAQALAARLDPLVQGGLRASSGIVCSVPPQHMFGFETSVLLSWVTGIPVLDRRPLLPLDVRTALADAGGAAAWIATPLHLRALAQSGEDVPGCRLALVSTMPLAQPLAAALEPRLHAPVVEIFGSTETGALATRRTAVESLWQPLDGVRLEHADGATLASGTHFPSPHTLGDVVEPGAGGRFALFGRHADMVKIGGRRASLSGLNLLLQDMPGLADGVLHVPADAGAGDRLVLVHAGPIERTAAERWLRARMDPVFVPRRWVQVERLPRDANGKLARPALDALLAQSPQRDGESAALDFDFAVDAGHPALPGHFPGQPIVPGVLLLDLLLERVRRCLGRDVTALPRVKFLAALRPDEAAHARFRHKDATLGFRISAGHAGTERVIAEGSLVLSAVREASPA